TFNPVSATAWRRVTLDRTALAGLLSQSQYVGLRLAAPLSTSLFVHGTGSAQPPPPTFWGPEPPALPAANGTTPAGSEGTPGSPRSFTCGVSLTQATTATVTVDYATQDSTAHAGSDYVAVSGTLTFAPGETTKTVTVPIIPDTDYEPTEYFYLTLSNPTNTSLGTLSGRGDILNDDPIPSATVTGATVTEPDSGSVPLPFTVQLSAASYQRITVSYSTFNGTAAAGFDYTAASGTLTFNPGETSKTVNVAVLGDLADENDETFTLSLTGGTNVTLGNPSTATGTILDND